MIPANRPSIRLIVLLLTLAAGCGQQKSTQTPVNSDSRPEISGAEPEPEPDLTPPTDLTEPRMDDGDPAAMAGSEAGGEVTAEMAEPGEPVARDGAPDPGPGSVRRIGSTVERRGFTAERVFYATNRAPETDPAAATNPDLYFSGERGSLSYGYCEVSIPYTHEPGTLAEPSPLLLEFSQDPARHVVLMEIDRLPDADFWRALRERVEQSEDKRMLVFVHGYCATFRDAARRTAQIAYDLNYQGPAMFFSWPAGSDSESFEVKANYLKDLRRAEQSDEDLVTVLQGISRFSGAQKIHLVAHSMGNFVLTEALRILDDRRGSQPPPLVFDQVALAAPDLDAAEYVERVADRIQPFGKRFTVYASTKDRALLVSKAVNSYEPLGSLNDYSRDGARRKLFDLIDASQMTSGWFDTGHIYYGDMPEVLTDFRLLFLGIQASSLQRGLAETPPLFRLMPRNP